MSGEKRDVILLTGFGPFKNHPVNASWEVVKLVASLDLESKLNAQLIIQEIPVEYDIVSKTVPALWKTHNPALLVHVGVSSQAMHVTLESCARNVGYSRPDTKNQTPGGEQCQCEGPEHIACALDLGKIARQVISTTGINAGTSVDAGRYLCEFTYYLSLHEDPKATIFVHIPPLDVIYSASQLAKAIEVVLLEGLKQARMLHTSNAVAS